MLYQCMLEPSLLDGPGEAALGLLLAITDRFMNEAGLQYRRPLYYMNEAGPYKGSFTPILSCF